MTCEIHTSLYYFKNLESAASEFQEIQGENQISSKL